MIEPSLDEQATRWIEDGDFFPVQQERFVRALVDSWRERGEALAAIRDSWDALPEGDNGPATFIRWLNEDMEPAIRKVRAAIGSPAKSQT